MQQLTILLILSGLIIIGLALAKIFRNGAIISMDEDIIFLKHFINSEMSQSNKANSVAYFRKIYSRGPTKEQIEKLDELEILFRNKYNWKGVLFTPYSKNADKNFKNR